MLKSRVTGFKSLQFEDAKEEPEGEGGHDVEDGVDDHDGGGSEAGVRGDHEQDATAAEPAAPGARDEAGADAAEGGQVHDFNCGKAHM